MFLFKILIFIRLISIYDNFLVCILVFYEFFIKIFKYFNKNTC
jgi:hypothetical protein